MGAALLGGSILLFLVFLLLLLVSRSHVGLYTARFARHHELRQLVTKAIPPNGLIIGTTGMRRHTACVQPRQTRREIGNMLIVAPTRGGKGLLAVSQLLTWQHSMIVNDIKGDLFSQTAGYRNRDGDVYVFDPTGVGHCYDPLAGKKSEEKLLSAATSLLFTPDEKDVIFTQRAIVMLSRIFAAAIKENIPCLPYTRSLINKGLGATAQRLNHIDPKLANRFLDTSLEDADLTSRFLLSCWSTLTTRLEPLLNDITIRSLTRSDFTAEDILCGKKPVTLYLKWKEQDLLALSPLVRLMWSSLIDELLTAYDQRQGQGANPVLMQIDEASRIAIPSLADHCTTVTGRGISLWIAIQSLSQLEAIYGKARAQIIRDNMETQLYYRPNDLATATYLEERIGNRSAYAHSTNERDGQETSTGRSERPVPLLPAQEIMQMQDEQVVAFHRNLPPFKVKRMDWRNHSHLIQRRNLPAPSLPELPPVADIPPMERASGDVPKGYIDLEDLSKGEAQSHTVFSFRSK
jgi:type IV secretion system protein VirD4